MRVMRTSLVTSLWMCFLPFAATAEIPTPVRSKAAFLDAENIVLCSDFEEFSASRVSLFLKNLEKKAVTPKLLDGPASLAKASGFNVLVVVSGTETQDSTLECALDTVPYGDDLIDEVNTSIHSLLEGFEHPNPTINSALGDTLRSSSIYYHEAENWITVVTSMRDPSAEQLDSTMISLFDLPEAACEQNPACLSR